MSVQRKDIKYVVDEYGCHNCISHYKRNGYPFAGRSVKGKAAAGNLVRFMYIEKYGDIPKGLEVMHLCDNKACINLEHVKLGTRAENMYTQKGTASVKGSQCGTAKLTELEVLDIRESRLPVKELAKLYQVGIGTINVILTGKSWKHVSGHIRKRIVSKKIPDKEILKIRNSNQLIAILADKYGVHESTISLIKNNKRRIDKQLLR